MKCFTPELEALAHRDVLGMIKSYENVEIVVRNLRRSIKIMKNNLTLADSSDRANYPVLVKEFRLQKARYQQVLKLRNAY
jgi:hypothetical protein